MYPWQVAGKNRIKSHALMKGHACLHVFRYVCPAFGESLLVLSFESDELRPDSASLSAAA